MPGTPVGSTYYDFYYDYENKRSRYSYTAGQKLGENIVYRFDKKVPGEFWSRAYKWKDGMEERAATSISARLTRVCEEQKMKVMAVTKGAQDMGQTQGGELWHKETHIEKLHMSSVEEWTLGGTNGIIEHYVINVTITGLRVNEDNTYSDIVLNNLTESDFDYPKFCDDHAAFDSSWWPARHAYVVRKLRGAMAS
eukprot:CAMPEP_0115870140 /NCGR_PEP_ID=MMETSP0287-20121206/22168_1 /TAXON_ID=412157 /ORGANISM="Chrysochromulina rotalis, Strain UIO044" /LENGTH=194 /DNA_ID=CAMNT_0003324843 /DNA_START=44 /DNA_END=627 /DNA_ORIENTATION=-